MPPEGRDGPNYEADDMEVDVPCRHGKGVEKSGSEENWRCQECNEPMTMVSLREIDNLRAHKESTKAPIGKLNSVTYNIPSAASDELRHILGDLLNEWRVQFTQANLEYGDGEHLGSKGVIPDLNRKMKKLKKSLWDGVELKREQPREVAMDMIGHLFLMIHLMDQGE